MILIRILIQNWKKLSYLSKYDDLEGTPNGNSSARPENESGGQAENIFRRDNGFEMEESLRLDLHYLQVYRCQSGYNQPTFQCERATWRPRGCRQWRGDAGGEMLEGRCWRGRCWRGRCLTTIRMINIGWGKTGLKEMSSNQSKCHQSKYLHTLLGIQLVLKLSRERKWIGEWGGTYSCTSGSNECLFHSPELSWVSPCSE